MRIPPKGRRARVVLPFQSRFDEFVRGDEIQIGWMADLFRKKLREQNVQLSEGEFSKVVEELRRRFSGEGGVTWDTPWQLDVEHEGEVSLDFGQGDLDSFEVFLKDGLPEIVRNLARECSGELLSHVLGGMDSDFDKRARDINDFRRRLMDCWRNPLKLLNTQIAISSQFGEDMNAWLRERSSVGNAAVVEAVIRLHARATQVAREVEALLQNGFADGAISRWRTLHEVCIVALFVQQQGEETAKRYLDHIEVDSRDMARFIQKAASKSGKTEISEEEMRTLEERVLFLRKTHGVEFDGYYGWASKAIQSIKHPQTGGGSKKVNPNFFDIEEAVDMDRLRPYYKLASGAVHAGSKGAYFKLGLYPEHSDRILAGPTNAGLSEAGRLTVWSLSMTSAALMMVDPMLDGIVWCNVIQELGSRASDAFVFAENQLRDEGAQWKSAHRFPFRVAGWKLRISEKPSERIRRRLQGS